MIGIDPIRAPHQEELDAEAKCTTKKSEIQCYKCKEYGHKSFGCPSRKIRRQGEAHPSKKNKTENQGQVQGEEGHFGQLPTPEPYLPFLPIICFACDKLGHKASMCPQKEKNKKRYQVPGATSKAIQGSTTAFYNYHNLHHYRTIKCPRPFCSRDASPSILVRLSFA